MIDPKLYALVSMLANAVSLLFTLLVVTGLWAVFVKARQPGWAALVPVYGNYVLTVKVARLPILWFYLQFAPAALMIAVVVLTCGAAGASGDGAVGVGVFVVGYALVLGLYYGVLGTVCVAVAGAFRRGVGFGVGLTLLPFVYFPLLGFNDDQYRPPKRAARPVEWDDGEEEDDDRPPPRQRRRSPEDEADDGPPRRWYDDEGGGRPRRRRSWD